MRTPQKVASDKRYYEANKEHLKALMCKNYQDNKTARAAKCRQYYLDHKEALIKYANDWHNQHKESRAKSGRAYRAKYPEKEVLHYQGYRARKRGAMGSHTTEEWLSIRAAHGGACAYCGSTGRIEKDHIIPLFAGGSHFASNLQPLCKTCNSRKGAKVLLQSTTTEPTEVQ